MKLRVGHKKAFDKWQFQAIEVINIRVPDSGTKIFKVYNNKIIELLDVQKLSSRPFSDHLREIEVLPTWSIEQVIRQVTGGELVVDEGRFRTYYDLYCFSASDSKLEHSKTMADYDIQEDDLLLLDKETEDLGVMAQTRVLSVRNLINFCDIVTTFEQSEDEQYHSIHLRGRPYAIYEGSIQGILLYTDEDVELAQYIRYNFSALDKMTGHHLDIYTIEQPTQVKGVSAREYWKTVLELNTYSFLHLMGWTKYKPYDKTESYRIAIMLGVYPDALPCIILFQRNVKSNPKIVISVTGESKTFFRGLTSVVVRTLEKVAKSEDNKDVNFYEFTKVFMESWSAWEKEVGERKEQETTFTFHGHTVFINRPSGHLEIKDFQHE